VIASPRAIRAAPEFAPATTPELPKCARRWTRLLFGNRILGGDQRPDDECRAERRKERGVDQTIDLEASGG